MTQKECEITLDIVNKKMGMIYDLTTSTVRYLDEESIEPLPVTPHFI